MNDDQLDKPLPKDAHKGRRLAAQQVRTWRGQLTDRDLDQLDHEEEFEDFEPLPRRRRKPRP